MARPTPEHRSLSFATVDDYARELDRLEAAEASGGLRVSGAYSPAQNFHHLARWIEMYEKGTLPKVPFVMKLVGPFMKKRLLTNGFPKGLPGPGGKPQTEPDNGFAESLAYLRAKLEVLGSRDLTHKNPFFGAMSHEESLTLQLKHGEHHLGFIHPAG
ncbi:MAG: DUF1569 domain-containing protein [Planctomycetota bacterium]